MTCIVCNGTPHYIGTLGHLDHFRCRNCGLMQYQETPDLFEEDEDPAEYEDYHSSLPWNQE